MTDQHQPPSLRVEWFDLAPEIKRQIAENLADAVLSQAEARLIRLQKISHSRAVQLENCGCGDMDTRAHCGNAETPDELYLSFEHCQHPDCRAAVDAAPNHAEAEARLTALESENAELKAKLAVLRSDLPEDSKGKKER